MRSLLIFLFFITSITTWSQITFTSPMTEYFPDIEVEHINRTISITEETIIIESVALIDTTLIQTFYIQEYSQQEFPHEGLSDFFVCSTKDGLNTTYFLIPVTDKVEYILALQPRQFKQQARRYRFLIE